MTCLRDGISVELKTASTWVFRLSASSRGALGVEKSLPREVALPGDGVKGMDWDVCLRVYFDRGSGEAPIGVCCL